MAKAKARIVTKKKQWVKILAPKVFNSMELGETYVHEKREAIGKTLSVNIMTLGQGGYRRQNIDVSFRVTGLHDEKAVTEFLGYRIIPSAIRRMIRRGKNKVDDSFVAKTADNKLVKIKPLLVTRSKANASVQTALRKAMRQYIAGELAKRKLDDFAKELVGHTFQKGMYNAGSKVYPLSTCEVRWALVTEEKKPVEKVEEMSETKVSEHAQKAKLSDKAEEKEEETEEVKAEAKEETGKAAPAVEEVPAEKPAEVNLSRAQKTSKSELSEVKESA